MVIQDSIFLCEKNGCTLAVYGKNHGYLHCAHVSDLDIRLPYIYHWTFGLEYVNFTLA